MRKDLDRRLKRLEAAFSVEQFDIIGGIVCVGMGSAEDHEPAANKEMSAVEIEEHEPAADEDILAKEMGSPEPIKVQQTVAEGEPAADEEWVEDWCVKADGRVSKIKERICSDPSDWGRTYRRDAMGKMSEDLGLERRVTKPGGGTIIWVVTKPGTKPFPTKVGTRVVKYA
jgi:hypothetical protein